MIAAVNNQDRQKRKVKQYQVSADVVLEVKNALCVILLQTEVMQLRNEKLNISKRIKLGLEETIWQVKRIDNLLPKVAFEGKDDV